MWNNIKHVKRDLSQWSFFLIIIGLFVSIPLFAICIYLFGGVGEMWEHITTYFLGDYTKNSVVLLVGTGLLCFLFGTSSAWIVTTYEFPMRKWIEWLLLLPLAIPSYIVAYAYVGLFGYGGAIIRLLNSAGIEIQTLDIMHIYGLIWILSCSLYPYVYAGARAMLKSIPPRMHESASLLGASHWRYMLTVALPLASPAIIGGLFLVFMEVLNDYGAAKYYGINTFTTGIFRSWTMLEDLQSAVYLSAILVLLILLLTSALQRFRGHKSYAETSTDLGTRGGQRLRVKGLGLIACVSITLLPIIFGFLLPAGQISYWSILTRKSSLTKGLFITSLQSLGVATTASILVVVFALVLVFFTRWNQLKALRMFTRIATVGYVVPGAIIGIGIIRSSQQIIDFFNNIFSLQIGFLFYASSAVLIYAYIFRFLTVAFNPISANSLKLGKFLHESSYLLGKGKLTTLFRIEIPLLRHALLSALILVFIDIMKELPLTLLLKPYDLQTLAVLAYTYADDERVAEAGWPSLILTLIIILFMLALNFLDRRVFDTPNTPNNTAVYRNKTK